MNDKQNDNQKESNGVLSQFLLSLIATTISIALTFGVSTLVENRKKEESKREIVLMVMYDMQQSLNMMTECHSKLANFFDAQLDFIANPAKFKEASKTLIQYYPSINFSTTTESIFNSNIETINIVGSVQFVQQVSSFYGFRREYKKSVMDDFNEGSMEMLTSYDNFVSFNTSEYPLISQSLINEMEKNKEMTLFEERDIVE